LHSGYTLHVHVCVAEIHHSFLPWGIYINTVSFIELCGIVKAVYWPEQTSRGRDAEGTFDWSLVGISVSKENSGSEITPESEREDCSQHLM
jgi:hypothetical protein